MISMNRVRSIGICLGATNFTLVELVQTTSGDVAISDFIITPHNGNPQKTVAAALEKYDLKNVRIGATGRKYRHLLNIPSIIEPEATEIAYARITGGERRHEAIVSAGGETFMVYELDRKSRISRISSGNKCASGTGEFFLQQIRRMNISLDEAVRLSRDSTRPYELSGRCSVFCKSDCTHALNKGESIANVAAGLSRMIAGKIEEMLLKLNVHTAMVVGGTARNPAVIEFLRTRFDAIDVPQEAPYFEAMGAALWALKNGHSFKTAQRGYFKPARSSFTFLPPISESAGRVIFKDMPFAEASDGDEYILGLDAGSTTTKAVLMRLSDDRIVKSEYLRTDGNPVEAARRCYRSLREQLQGRRIRVPGLGVTGSGRYIAGLHADTGGIINEIIAHAKAAAFFDPDVDTIYEIGGQDAKYTFLNNQVASDYAMNEACSAGTGSFLEESAFETLNVRMTDIAEIALSAERAPNFSDQCAAFISSDINTALQEGVPRDAVIAGLVYSICQNYINRVRGSRPTGARVFMQGGVCYNRAVPMAMAGLIGREIIVPPHPGLMGAYGVALEYKELLRCGRLPVKEFDLEILSARAVEYDEPFLCSGKPEGCDRKCSIKMIRLAGKRIPFGGACNKYYNLANRVKIAARNCNHVDKRDRLLFGENPCITNADSPAGPTVGINRSFHTYTLFPFYSAFFAGLGCRIMLPDTIRQTGIDKGMTSYCLSGKLALGYGEDLALKHPDYIFMPQIKEMHVAHEERYRIEYQTTCMFLQGEPWYQYATHLKMMENPPRLIAPVLNLMSGFDAEEAAFITIAERMGFSTRDGERAHHAAVEAQLGFIRAKKEEGKKILDELEKDPSRFAVVLFGHPYNAFTDEANKGIPRKFASRGVDIIPFDFLLYQDEPNFRNTYWEMGQKMIKAARIVVRHPQLFGCYLTNFLCAVDSMMITHFRDLMGNKPSLTIEVDTHTADAGVNTRIEAFLDIIGNYLRGKGRTICGEKPFTPARLVLGQTGGIRLFDSDGRERNIRDSSVRVLVPSLGTYFAEGIASALCGMGWNASALEQCDREALDMGRRVTTGKECLPIINIIGEVLKYLRYRQSGDELTVVVMVGSGGCCRVGQYATLLDRTINHSRLRNVVQLVLSNDDGFAGLGVKFRLNSLRALYAGDILDDIRSVITTLARDREEGLRILEEEKNAIFASIRGEGGCRFFRQTAESIKKLVAIELKTPLSRARYIGVVGEIFVRRDHFSLMGIPDMLAQKGFVMLDAPVSEWLRYTDFLRAIKMFDVRRTLAGRLEYLAANVIHDFYERKLKRMFARSGLYEPEIIDVRRSLAHSTHFFPLAFTGEPGLSSGSALNHLIDKYCGVIAVGPFGCMNSRMTEGVATAEMTLDGKERASYNAGLRIDLEEYRSEIDALPFLNLEFDGNPLSQIDESRLESFMLQAGRLAELRERLTVNGSDGFGGRRRRSRPVDTIALDSFMGVNRWNND